MTATRERVVADMATAARCVESGMTIGVGGLGTSSHPMALLHQVIRQGARDLTVVAGPMAGLDVDLLIAAGCVREVVCSYVGAERLASIGPAYRRAVEHGDVAVREVDEGIWVQGLRAAAQLVPFQAWRGGVGTALPDRNPDLRPIEDPFGGPALLAVRALPLDVAILHAATADAYGNVQPIGTGFADRLQSQAADLTVVQVERIESNEGIRRAPWLTTIPDADMVVHAPGGAHPYASPGYFVEDEDFLHDYVAAAKSGGATLAEWLDRYVYGCADHHDYLDLIGLRRLFGLGEHP
ncbi:CoA transferase subunit A [Actinomadura sp. KC345]|uniref:CoA transferase subunit A n=1 Tax=Actinomadura sp. KC345 TaxID=2530371 RepID=UPI0010474A83|nr:CoA-transferase [Actinomadura sp. KC345]TDC58555.1 CoA transferase subunit A [Actinomadura sp. KC345]